MLEIVKDKKTAILLGATGLVGGYCLDYLLEHAAYTRVKVLTRRKLKKEHSKLEQYVVDFDRPASFSTLISGDDLFCCLGTTMAKAGSKEAFYQVDYTYTYEIARIASRNGVNQVFLVSSVGADPDSIFFYNRVKGELEEAIKDLPFWSIHIFQPSVLLGKRNESRWGERLAGSLGRVIDNLTGGLLTKYRPVEAESVAEAMVKAAQGLQKGIHVYPSHVLQELANQDDMKRLDR